MRHRFAERAVHLPRAFRSAQREASIQPARARLLRLLLAALFLACAPTYSAAEETRATLSGSILSTVGLGLPGATVRIVNVDTGQVVSLVAGDGGVWRSGPLAPGSYEVSAETVGYLPARATVTLTAGEAGSLDLELTPYAFEESVTVTATAPRDSLEASRIRESGARDAAEALTALPGVWMVRRGGIAGETVVRGLQARDTSLTIDGQRVYGACPNHMDPPTFHVDFAEVDRIEISKGPFDVRNRGGLGGSVNIVTRRAEQGWHAAPVLAAGSWGYLNPSVTASYGRRSVSFLAGYSEKSSRPYRDGSGLPFTAVADYRSPEIDGESFRVATGWARAAFEPRDGHRVRISWSGQQADDVRYPYLSMDALYDDTFRAGVSYDYSGAGRLDGLTVQTYYTRVSHWMTDELRLTSLTAPRDYSMGSLAGTRTAGGRVEGRWGRITAGLEVSRRFWEMRTFMAGMSYAPQEALPGVVVTTAAVYAETEVPLASRWTLHAGGRVERTDSEADERRAPTGLYEAYHLTRSTSSVDTLPAGNVRLVWRHDDGITVSGGVGTSARVPEPNELFFGLKRAGADWVGDPGLSPVRNVGVDLAATVRRGGHDIGVSAFQYHLLDDIIVRDQPRVQAVPGVMNTVARSYLNDDATLRGVELDTTFSLTSRVTLGVDLSYVQGRQDLDVDRGVTTTSLAETPPLRGRTSVRFNASTWWVEAEGVFSAAQGRVDTDLLEQPTSSWSILDLRGGIDRGAWRVALGVSNVFDRLYTDHLSYLRDPFRTGTRVYEPGIGFFGTVGYRF